MKDIAVSKIWIWLSVLISGLVLTASLLGIFDREVYSQETANWALQAVGQDIGNLFAVIAILGSTYHLRKNSLRAYFIWLGVLLYFIYAYLIYAFFIHFNYLFLVYVAVLGLSFYSLAGALAGQDMATLLKHTKADKRNKLAGIVLIVIGVLFGFLWLLEIIPSLLTGKVPQSLITSGLWVNPIQVIDLALVLPGMILTGILLWKRRQLGFVFAAPWLMFSILMGTSIVVTMIMELNNGNPDAIAPMVMVGIIVIASVLSLLSYLKNIK